MATNLFSNLASQLSPKGDYTSWLSSFSQPKKTATPMATSPTPLISSNTSATAPATKPVAATPAKQQFVQSQIQSPQQQQQTPPAYDTTSGLLTDYGRSQGLQEVNRGSTGQTQPSGAIPAPKADPYRSAFDAYIKSLTIPDDITRDSQRLAGIESDIFGKELQGRRAQEEALDAPGGLKAGAQQASQMIGRRSNAELADLAVQQNALANSLNARMGQYNAMSQAEKARFDFEKSLLDDIREQERYESEQASKLNQPFELSEGQSRYEYDPATGEYKQIASKAKTYAPSAGGSTGTSTGITDASGRPIKLTATQADAITGFENTKGAAEAALALLEGGVSTGPIAGRLLQGAKLIGNQNPDQLRLEQTLAKLKADFMKAISGAAVSESEAQRLASFLPEITDQETVIASKLAQLVTESERTKQNLLNTLGAVTTTDVGESDLVQAVTEAGYDYAAMRADGFSDAEIKAALKL